MNLVHYTVNNCCVVILAAGSSSRLGKPKQLLKYKSKSLVQYIVDVAILSNIGPVIVVTGANAALIIKEISDKKIYIVKNEEWKEGMASSLRCGLSKVQIIDDTIDGIIFMVCDQPYVSVSLIAGLLKKQHDSGLPIVASSYENILGTPVLFHKKFFEELHQLQGDTGARKLVKKYSELTATIPFPKGGIDIDTEEDFQRLLKEN